MLQNIKSLLRHEIHQMMNHALPGQNGRVSWKGMEQYAKELQAMDKLERFTTGFVHGDDKRSVSFTVNKYVINAEFRRVTVDTRNSIDCRCIVEVDMPEAHRTATMKVVDLVALLELGHM